MLRVDTNLAWLREEISAFMQAYPDNNPSSRANLEQVLRAEPQAFTQSALHVLMSTPGSPGWKYIAQMLPKDTADRATAGATSGFGAELESALDFELHSQVGGDMRTDDRILRILEVMEITGAERRCVQFQHELLDPGTNPTVRSKAAKLLTWATRKTTLAAKLLMDQDPRVQASAIEALWKFEESEATPLFIAASRAKHHRVVGNAAVGLYRLGNLAALRIIWGMVNHSDPQTRIAGVWVMGETGDLRFMPYLEELSQTDGTGVPKPVALRALTRLRARLSELMASGELTVRIHEVAADAADSWRRLQLTLGPAAIDFRPLKALNFAVFENGKTISEYELRVKPNSSQIHTSFIVPRILSIADPWRVAFEAGIESCLQFKRPHDSWRLDRYAVESRVQREWLKDDTPYDDSIPRARMQRGFISDLDLVRQVIRNLGPKERAASDLPRALERGLSALSGQPGAHQMFLFVADGWLDSELLPRWLRYLPEQIENSRVRVCVFAPEGFDGGDMMDILIRMPNCTIHTCTPETLQARVETVAAQSLNNFEIAYRTDSTVGTGRVIVSGNYGYGEASFELS